jgi:hypothetical protein
MIHSVRLTKIRLPLLLALLCSLLLGAATVRAQFPGAPNSGADAYEAMDEAGEFAFVRLRYNSMFASGWGYGYGPWAVDFPDADINFLRGVGRLSNIRVMRDPIVLSADDQRIFEYPILYALEMGRAGGPVFSEVERHNLREYLLRGGFLIVDDFWGMREWEVFRNAIMQILPDHEVVELPHDHEIFRIYYDIDGPKMIPHGGNPQNIPERDVDHASLHAVKDDDGRIMVLINWNTDLGDGWEYTYSQHYPTRFSNQAYQLGLNYLIYSFTH